MEDELNAQVDFSFNSDDSFEPIVSGPQMRPKKPACVPYLNLDGLPEYVTSSDEEHESGKEVEQTPMKQKLPQQESYYEESMKYIDQYYKSHEN